ncbi:MAG: hypothetical protein C0624_12900 [Desulfuromonas sp.]|nr:MAG: hypothetical protein C0624_12900 [Desulfuromonas sp.]
MAKVLLVDDVELFLELEQSYFEGTGHETLKATSGALALELLDKEQPDIMLLDLYMPEMNGAEVCSQVRSNADWQHLPVIMVTSAGKEEEIRRCLEAGCDDYVTKPVNRKELLEKINRLLGEVKYRTEPRLPVSFTASLTVNGQQEKCQVLDLSSTGAFIQTENLIEVGTSLLLSMELPTCGALEIAARVRRIEVGQPAGIGVYFVRPPACIGEYVSSLPTESPKEKEVQEELEDLPLDTLREEVLQLRRFQSNADDELQRMNRRVIELEQENREFAEKLVHVEDVNNNLANLYIASSRLHSVLQRSQVSEIIKEIIINFIGAEKFAILLQKEGGEQYEYEGGEGFEGEVFPKVKTGEGRIGKVAAEGESYFAEGSVCEGSDDPLNPLVAIPLNIHGKTTGVLAVYRLFIQKEEFESIDYQLFSMLAEHAATALFSASLYEVSERKRETYKGFMDLLLQQ